MTTEPYPSRAERSPAGSRLRQALTRSLVIGATLAAPATAQYQLVWADEFNGSSLDLTKWQPEIGTGCPNLCGWGNNELQYYRAENATVGGGQLTITARQQSFGGASYTSARLRTKNQGDWTYGRFEMRAKLPVGQGIWPAFWMLPTDNVYGTWAASGEIDIMEYVGQDPDRVLGTLHYGAPWPDNVYSGDDYVLPTGNFDDDFHVFAIEWDEFEMRWFVDGVHYSTQTSWWSSGAAYPAPFNERFHLLLNMAVGGNLPGPPNGSTQFPQEYVIDYVRVYQELDHDLSTCLCTFDDMEHANPLANGYFTFSAPSAGGGINSNTGDVPPVNGGNASLDAGWGAGGAAGYYGGFGRTYPLDLTGADHFEMWINPDAGQEYTIEVNLLDDDNGDNAIPSAPDGADDEFQYALSVGPPGSEVLSGGGWQKVSIPLSSFSDDNSYHFGGNGVFDPAPTSAGSNGQMIGVVLALVSSNGADITFRTDNWMFTRHGSYVAGRVWSDLDGNGSDTGEPGLAGVRVEAYDPVLDTVVASSVTGAVGQYSINNVFQGSYVIRIDPSTLPVGATPTFDPDGLATPGEFDQTLACDETVSMRDFGYQPGAGGVTNYCSSEPNSVGPGSLISHDGSISISANNFVIQQSGGIPNGFGLFYFGPNEIDLPFGEGRRCVGGGVFRIAPAQVADASGDSARALDFATVPGNNIDAGSTWKFQYWYRDPPGGPSGFNLSDGLSATYAP